MKTELKDVIHFYIGIQSVIKNSKAEIIDVIAGPTIEHLYLGNWEVKPILRPLSDMTINERSDCFNLSDQNPHTYIGGAIRTAFLLKQGFDLFGLIESGQAIDKTTL